MGTSDGLEARALSAQGTLTSRAWLHGLGVTCQAGVTKTLEIIHKELDLKIVFCGKTDINTVDQGILLLGTFPVA